MLVLNDAQGALNYVWEFKNTPVSSGTSTHAAGTFQNSQAILDRNHGTASIYAKSELGFGSADGVVVSGSATIMTLTMKVTGSRLRDARVTGFPPGDIVSQIQISGLGLNYTQSILMSTTVPSKGLPDEILFRVEMDNAQLTGTCSQYRLRFSALRVYVNGTLRASRGSLDLSYAPDARKIYVLMDPRVTNPFTIDPAVYGGPFQEKTTGTTGPFSTGGGENPPNPGTNASHFVSTDHPIRFGWGATNIFHFPNSPSLNYPPRYTSYLVKTSADRTYQCKIRGSWSHSGATYPDIEWSMPDPLEDVCTEECLGYVGPTFHSDRDVEVKAELHVEWLPLVSGDKDILGTYQVIYTGIDVADAEYGYVRNHNILNYSEVTALLVNNDSPMQSRATYQAVRCLPNTGARVSAYPIIDDSSTGTISTGDVCVIRAEFEEWVPFEIPTTPPTPLPPYSTPNVRKSNESVVNTIHPSLPRCPSAGTGDQLGLTYWLGCYFEALPISTGVRVKMDTVAVNVHTTDLATGANTTSPGLTVNALGHLILAYHIGGTIYRRVSENSGRNWGTAASVASGSMVTVTTDRINDIEYHAVRNSTTWKLYRKRPQDSSPVFVVDIVTGVSSDSTAGITWVDSSETPLVFVYVSSGTRYRKISTDFGATWATA